MRYAIAVLGLLVLIAGLAGVKGAQIGKLIAFGKQAEQAGPPPEAVSTMRAEEQEWEGTLSAVGSVAAAKGVGLSSESAGVVTRLHFESGEVAKQGKVLVELDTSVERAQLDSARAKKALAEVQLVRSRALVRSGAQPQSQLDADQSALDSAAAEVASLEAQIARKVVRAPFTGRLGIRAVNLGQYLAPGTQVTVLETIDSVYVDFTLPQERLQSLQTGLPVRVTLLWGTALDGTVVAIDPRVDSATRTIQVRAAVPNREERLRPGMFVSVSVILPERLKVVAVPATAVVHAPYGDSVFLVEEAKDSSGNPLRAPDGSPIGVARQQFVRLSEARGDFVAVVEGLAPGQEVVSAGAFKLRNGTRVTVTPDVKPAPELAPHPQNR